MQRSILFTLMLALLAFPAFSLAQEDDTASQAADVLAQTVDIDEETGEILDLTLTEVQIEEPTRVPSTFGIWMKTFRENVSLVLTRDPVKKAEKQLQFAEERQRLAQFIAENSDNAKAQEKAAKMIERAEKMFEKIDQNKDKWINLQGERMRRLAKNLATHQVRRERVLDRLEEIMPPERRERIYQQKERLHARAERLFASFEENGMSDEVRAHAAQMRQRVERSKQRFDQFRSDMRELQERAAGGDEEALERFMKQREEHVQRRSDRAEEKLEQVKDRLRRDAAQGGEGAQAAERLLENIEDTQERVERRAERRDERRERADNQAQGGEAQEEVEQERVEQPQPRRRGNVLQLLGDEPEEGVEDEQEDEPEQNVQEEPAPKKEVPQKAKERAQNRFEKAIDKKKASVPSLKDAAGSRGDQQEDEPEEEPADNEGSRLNIRRQIVPLGNVLEQPDVVRQDRGNLIGDDDDNGGVRQFQLQPIPLNTGVQPLNR